MFFSNDKLIIFKSHLSNNPVICMFVVSTLLHLSIVALLFSGTNNKQTQEISTHTVDIHYSAANQQTQKPNNNRGLERPTAKSLKTKHHNAKSSLKESLAPRVNYIAKYSNDSGFQKATTKPAQSHFTNSYSSDGVIGQMQSMSTNEYMKTLPFYDGLWKKVNSSLDYPIEFINQYKQGNVTATVQLSSKGILLPYKIDVQSSNLFLKTYITALLLHILKTPLPPENWHKDNKGKFTIALNFNFKLHSVHDSVNKHPGTHFKNSLVFNRENYVEPVINREVRHIITNYVPPVFPIPGGFYIDFIHAYQMVKNFIDNKPSEKDQKRKNFEQLMDQLKYSVKKSQPKSSSKSTLSIPTS